jgi:hypothetical protein
LLLPQKRNAYAYCANLPLTSIDPTGMENEDDICSSVEFAGKCVDGPSDTQSVPMANPIADTAPGGNADQEIDARPSGEELGIVSTANANGVVSHGTCAKSIREDLEIETQSCQKPPSSGKAKDYGPMVERAGCYPIAENASTQPTSGRIAIIQPPVGAVNSHGNVTLPDNAGHIETGNNEHWVSDFIQSGPRATAGGMYPGVEYLRAQPDDIIYQCMPSPP